MNRKNLWRILSSLIFVLLLQTQGFSAYTEEELLPVRMPSIAYTTYAQPFIVADIKGFFREEGIKPIFTGAIPAGQHVAAVVARTNDVGERHVNRTIKAIASGAKIKMVVAGTRSTKQYPHMIYMVLENSPIRTAQDMLGKNVGVSSIGGCHEYTPYAWLEKELGITDPKNKFTFLAVPGGSEELALRQGAVDVYGFMSDPLDVKSRGGVRALFDDVDIFGDIGGNTPWYFLEDFIEKNPETVRRFVKAIAKTHDWVNAHPDESRAITAKFFDVDIDKIGSVYWEPHGIIHEDTIQIWIDLMVRYGELTEPISAKDLYTNEFNEFYITEQEAAKKP
jgi:ABC-type nitrate/sulfonate/bicarbonate transport system substrate-binding protein